MFITYPLTPKISVAKQIFSLEKERDVNCLSANILSLSFTSIHFTIHNTVRSNKKKSE
jgi:hypothetical protein